MMAQKFDSLGAVPVLPDPTLPPDWLVKAMLIGIGDLCAHPLLKNPDSAEAEKEMAIAWAKAAMVGRRWNEETDPSRIASAFAYLGTGYRKDPSLASYFPNFHDLMEALPAKYSANPQYTATPIEQEIAKERLAQILARWRERNDQQAKE